jgi:hypothetical protein
MDEDVAQARDLAPFDRGRDMDWYILVVDQHPGKRCYLTPLSLELIARIGACPGAAIVGEALNAAEAIMSKSPGRMRPEEFVPNPAFAHFLHAVLARRAPNCPGVRREAQRQRHGYVYILDARTPDPQGDVPGADVIGAVELQDGRPGKYIGSPNYEPYGHHGLMQLESWLEARFMEELLALAQRRPS